MRSNLMRSNLICATVALMVLAVAIPNASADDDAKLQAKVAELEKVVKDLAKTVEDQAGEIQRLKADDSGEKYRAELAAVRQRLDAGGATAPSGWFSVVAKQKIELYGYLKLDAAWDSARTSTGNFAQWVESEGSRSNDDEFNMTARQTRLGFRLTDPDGGDLKTTGRVEIDFYGSGAENKPQPFMRHAYLKLDWQSKRFSILAGQTSDVISPLVPGTINYTVLWWSGNIGYRRPQIRATKGFTLAKDVDLETQVAVARNIGRDSDDFDPGDTGEDHCLPSLQGRVAVSFPLFDANRTTVGLSGHWGNEEIDTDEFDNHENVCSWSANVDVNMPINSWLSAKGELFTGQNLDAYLGGIGQGVDMTTYGTIQSCGGWGAMALGPWDNWRFNVGAGVESVDAGDVTSDSARTLNRSIFGNVVYQITKNASVAFEIMHLHTEYKNDGDGEAVRLQSALMYKF